MKTWNTWDELFDIELSGRPYEFHLLRVLRRSSDNAIVWAIDSGCSCPTPFESLEDDDWNNILYTCDDLRKYLDSNEVDYSYGLDDILREFWSLVASE